MSTDYFLLREAIKKTYEILDIVQKVGGESAKLFIEEKFGHVLRGGVSEGRESQSRD